MSQPRMRRTSPFTALGRLAALALATTAVAWSAPAPAATAPDEVVVGDEVQLPARPGDDFAVALGPNGIGLVVHTSGATLQAFRLADGQLAGGPIPLASRGAGSKRSLQVAADAAGDFVLAWQEQVLTGDRLPDVLAQRMSRHGVRRGGLIVAPTAPAGPETEPRLGVAPDGRFALAWEDRIVRQGVAEDVIRLQRFGVQGNRLGRELTLPAAAKPTNLLGAVAATEAFVSVGWNDIQPCAAREVGPDDERAGVAHYAWGQGTPQVERFDDGAFCTLGPAVTAVLGSDYGTAAVFAGNNFNFQRFDPATAERVGPRVVFADGDPDVRLIAVAGDARGRFLAIWEETIAHGDFRQLSAQLFGRDGKARTARVLVSSVDSLEPQRAAAALQTNGEALVVFNRVGQDAADSGAFVRGFRFPD